VIKELFILKSKTQFVGDQKAKTAAVVELAVNVNSALGDCGISFRGRTRYTGTFILNRLEVILYSILINLSAALYVQMLLL
jgi:hypothetical protein